MKIINHLRAFSLAVFVFVTVGTSAQPYAVYHEGLINNIQPTGWLHEFLYRQKTGLTGHPEAMAYPYNSCLWAGEIPRVNENPDAKDWWRYEQTAYYTDGLLRLGYLLNDQSMINTGQNGINYTLEHVQSNGRLGNAKIESLWPMAVFFRAMQANYWATGNEEIIKALEKNYLSLSVDLLTNGRRHICNLEGMLWVYGLTGNEQLLKLAEDAYNRGGFELDANVAGSSNIGSFHGVTYAEMLKIPLILYAYTGKDRYLNIALNAERRLESDHLLPDGLYTSAEYTLGQDVDIAHETCDITDYTWSLGYFLQVTGQAEWADRLERAIFNAGLGAITKDFKTLQYFSSVNQLICTGSSDNNAFKRGSTWMAYRPVHETECCVGNVNRFMPNFASRLWMRGNNNEVVATLYAPNKTTFNVNGHDVTITEETAYPFSETVRFTITTGGGSVNVPLMLRIPGWCSDANLSVNGNPVSQKLTASTFVTLNQSFANGDVVELQLPMKAKLQEAANGQGWYVERGPLLYSYAVPQQKVEDTKTYSNMNGKKSGNADFKCWSITPDGAYNYGFDPSLVTSEELKVNVDESRLSAGYPFDLQNAPISIEMPVRKIMWSVQNGRNPNLPSAESIVALNETETVKLVPYGCTELRLTVFPEATEANIPEPSLIVNPDFEMVDANNYNAGGTEHKTYVPYGWNVQGQINGVSYGINSDSKNHHGDNVCWFRLLPFSENFELYQVIPAAKLEAGTYKVSCKLWNGYNFKGNCRLFANNSVQYFGSKDEYVLNFVEGEDATFAGYGGTQDGNFYLENMQVYVTVKAGEDLRIGIRSDGRKSDGTRPSDGTGWFKVDDFHLEKVESVPFDNGDDDMNLTSALITNYDFELATNGQVNPVGGVSRGVPYGWKIATEFKGNSYGVSGDGLNKHANNVCWFNNAGGAMPDNFELYQEIPATKIEAGRYQVRCRLWVEAGMLGKCRLFANNSVQYFGKESDYQQNQTAGETATFAGYEGGQNNNFIMRDMVVYVDVAEGESLRLGLRSGNKHGNGVNDGGNSGWFKCDFFRIKRVDSASNAPGTDPDSKPEPKETASVFIVCGQSNSDGRIPKGDYPEYMQTDRAMYCYDDGANFQYGKFSPYRPYTYMANETNRFGYDAFVYHYIQKAQEDPFYIVKTTLGGSAIDPSCVNSNRGQFWSCDPTWLSGESATNDGGHSLMKSFEKSFVACQTQTLNALKKGYKVRAILWHQGEGDRGYNGPANYYKNLTTLIAHMRQFLYEKTGDADCLTLPFILGTVSHSSTQYNADVEAAHLRIANEDANVHAINLDGQPLLGDNLHFGVEAGQYYGQQVFNKLVDLGMYSPIEFEKDTQITNDVMINPDFELDLDGKANPRGTVCRGVPYGWETNTTLSGNSFGINSDAFNFHGNNVCWMNATPMPADFKLYQTIPANKLGAGRYTVKCKLWVEMNKKNSCRLFANDVVQYYGFENDYTNLLVSGEEATYAGWDGGGTNPLIMMPLSVTIDLAEGEDLTIGIHTGNKRNNGQTSTDNAGWFKVDNFRIYKENKPVDTGIVTTCGDDEKSDAVYDLLGRKVAIAQTQLLLKNGIYVRRGHKVFINKSL